MRARAPATAGAVLAGAVLALAGCAGGPGTAVHHAARHTAAAATAAPSPPTAETVWEQGPGLADFLSAGAAAYRAGRDLGSGNLAALKGLTGDGDALASAAAIAQRHPSPAGTRDYKRSMAYWALTGIAMGAGDWGQADRMGRKAKAAFASWDAVQPGTFDCGNWSC